MHGSILLASVATAVASPPPPSPTPLPPGWAGPSHVTWRGSILGEVNAGQQLTISGGSPWNGGVGVSYESQTLASYGIQLPIVATTDVNTASSNTLVLAHRTKVYMLRADEWSTVDLTGWTDTGVRVCGVHIYIYICLYSSSRFCSNCLVSTNLILVVSWHILGFDPPACRGLR